MLFLLADPRVADGGEVVRGWDRESRDARFAVGVGAADAEGEDALGIAGVDWGWRLRGLLVAELFAVDVIGAEGVGRSDDVFGDGALAGVVDVDGWRDDVDSFSVCTLRGREVTDFWASRIVFQGERGGEKRPPVGCLKRCER